MNKSIKKNIFDIYFTKEFFYLVTAIICYILYNQLSFNPIIQRFFKDYIFKVKTINDSVNSYYNCIIWFITSIIYLFIIPLIFCFIIEKKEIFSKMGFLLPNKKFGFLLIIPALIVMIVTISIIVKIYPGFKLYYPFSKYALVSNKLFIIYEILYFFYFISWEFFCHSFLVYPYEKKFGKNGAMLIGLMPFVILHFGKPLPEVFGSLIAGIFLSILALETRSFWYGMLLHGIVAVYMDIAVKFL